LMQFVCNLHIFSTPFLINVDFRNDYEEN